MPNAFLAARTSESERHIPTREHRPTEQDTADVLVINNTLSRGE